MVDLGDWGNLDHCCWDNLGGCCLDNLDGYCQDKMDGWDIVDGWGIVDDCCQDTHHQILHRHLHNFDNCCRTAVVGNIGILEVQNKLRRNSTCIHLRYGMNLGDIEIVLYLYMLVVHCQIHNRILHWCYPP